MEMPFFYVFSFIVSLYVSSFVCCAFYKQNYIIRLKTVTKSCIFILSLDVITDAVLSHRYILFFFNSGRKTWSCKRTRSFHFPLCIWHVLCSVNAAGREELYASFAFISKYWSWNTLPVVDRCHTIIWLVNDVEKICTFTCSLLLLLLAHH